jgi:hypothetical protein
MMQQKKNNEVFYEDPEKLMKGVYDRDSQAKLINKEYKTTKWTIS